MIPAAPPAANDDFLNQATGGNKPRAPGAKPSPRPGAQPPPVPGTEPDQ